MESLIVFVGTVIFIIGMIQIVSLTIETSASIHPKPTPTKRLAIAAICISSGLMIAIFVPKKVEEIEKKNEASEYGSFIEDHDDRNYDIYVDGRLVDYFPDYNYFSSNNNGVAWSVDENNQDIFIETIKDRYTS